VPDEISYEVPSSTIINLTMLDGNAKVAQLKDHQRMAMQIQNIAQTKPRQLTPGRKSSRMVEKINPINLNPIFS
jgi:hypothetical protein